MIPNSSVVYQLIMGGYQQNQQKPPVVQNDAVDALLSLKKLNYEVREPDIVQYILTFCKG